MKKLSEKYSYKRYTPGIISLLILYCLTSPLHAQNFENRNISLSIQPNVQIHDLSWSIAGNLNGTNPNIFSEVRWKNIVTPAVESGLNIRILKRFFIASRYNYGVTVKGSATDTDYSNDGRNNISFYAKVQSNKGSTSTFNSSFGWYAVSNAFFQLQISAGYGVDNQSLSLTDDFSLDSSYKTYWRGPTLEVKQKLKFLEDVSLNVVGIYMQSRYSAEANWNLMDMYQHPVSFRHRAKGFGFTGTADIQMRISSHAHAKVGSSFFYNSTGAGIDELYFTSGLVQKTRLNDVTRKGYALFFGLEFIW